MTSDVECEIDLGIPLSVAYVQVVDILGADPVAIVAPAVSEVRLAIGARNHGLSVEVDWLVEGSEQSRLPMRWYAAGRPAFPAMTADLVVLRRPWAEAELRLVARYRPLFGGDSAALRSVAERTAKTFLDAVARRITAQTMAHPRDG